MIIGNTKGFIKGKALSVEGHTHTEYALSSHTHTTSQVTGLDDEINNLKTSVSEGKSLIAAAVTDKGVETAADATFNTIATNIGNIPTGTDTSDGTATASDIAYGKIAYSNGERLIGTRSTTKSVSMYLANDSVLTETTLANANTWYTLKSWSIGASYTKANISCTLSYKTNPYDSGYSTLSWVINTSLSAGLRYIESCPNLDRLYGGKRCIYFTGSYIYFQLMIEETSGIEAEARIRSCTGTATMTW